MKHYFKTLLIAFASLAIATQVHAQSYTLSDISKGSQRNSGTIVDGNIIKGYYFFYKTEKVSRKENAYEIVILDENLEEKASKRIIEPKTTYLLEAAYNGQNIVFKFYDTKSDEVSYRSMNSEGKLSSKESRETNKHEALTYGGNITADLENTCLQAVNSKLFIDIHNYKDKQFKYSMEGLNNKGEVQWTFTPENEMKVEAGAFLGSSDDQIWVQVSKSKGVMSKDYKFDIVGVSTDGEQEFRLELQNSKYNLLAHNASYNATNDEIVIIGEYFDIKDKSMKSDSKGVFVKVITPDGSEVSENFISWTRDVAAMVSAEDKRDLSKYYICFHNIVQTADGRIIAIGEQYRKQVSAKGVAMNMLAASSSNISTSAGMAEIKIGKMVVLEIDKQYELSSVDIHDKRVRNEVLPQGYGTVSQHLIARVLQSIGAFDYAFTQNNEDNSIVSFAYTDLEKEKGKLRKKAVLNFVSYIKDEDDYSSDKVDLESDAFWMHYMPAKPGNILIVEYFKKEKTLELRLEPINY